jgi:5-methylcytosine-specific restriction protein A
VFERVLSEFAAQRGQPFGGDELAHFIRHDLRDAVAAQAPDDYLVDASPGAGRWAETPWVALFDPLITESAMRGFYAVYLFAGDGSMLQLSLNQGTTVVRTAVGRRYRQVLEARATALAGLLGGGDLNGLLQGPLSLPGHTALTRGYNAGNIASRSYLATSLPDEGTLAQDLTRILGLYQRLIDARETVEEATGEELPPGVALGEEGQRYRWHRRAERNRRLARAAKGHHGTRCKVCGLDFSERYGPRGSGYIEAHHLTPMSELVKRPDPGLVSPVTDFTVVCSNCHRMLHATTPAASPEELQEVMRSLNRD